MTAPDTSGQLPSGSGSPRFSGEQFGRMLDEANALDRAIYNAITETPTPTLDLPLTWISKAATYSRMWLVIAAVLAIAGGNRGRRAAIRGVASIGISSFTADLAAKHLFPRTRPVRATPVVGRKARMPTSSSFPSGHAASAFAFAAVVTDDFPELSLPLYCMAAAVGYSRIHMGVHYPSDVVGGAVLGLALGSNLRATFLPS